MPAHLTTSKQGRDTQQAAAIEPTGGIASRTAGPPSSVTTLDAPEPSFTLCSVDLCRVDGTKEQSPTATLEAPQRENNARHNSFPGVRRVIDSLLPLVLQRMAQRRRQPQRLARGRHQHHHHLGSE